jgi:pectate lyase
MKSPRRAITFILGIVCVQASAQTVAFPGAEGFGALATGGRGGSVVHVTTLDDSGPGSFREAVAKSKSIVVFDVGGLITLKSPLSISSDITIAGQSAPGDGVALYGNPVSVSNVHNVIIRYLRFREGINGPKGKCSVNMHQADNIILDHCSIEWGRWDCLGPTESTNITIQWCIIGEGVDPQRFGCLCETDNITFSHNLWIDNQSRNPKAKGKVQYVNNVVYNWGVCGLVGGHSAADHWTDAINNVFIKGPNSGKNFVGEFAKTDQVYQSGNLVDDNRNGKFDPREVIDGDFSGPTLTKSPGVVPKIAVTVDPASEALENILAGAGASLHRDAIDMQLIEQVKSIGAKGEIIKDESAVEGHPALKGGEPHTDYPADPAKLEDYLNSLAK